MLKWMLSAIVAGSLPIATCSARPPQTISTDPELLDYLIQDVCVDTAGTATSEDPATCGSHRNIKLGELSPYIVTDFDRGNGMTYAAMNSVPVRAPDGGLRVMVSKSLQTDFRPDFSFTFSAARDGYDLIDTTNSDFVSFIRTSDGGCFDQIFSRNGKIGSVSDRAGGWAIFPRSAPSTWAQSASARITTYKVQLTRNRAGCRDSHAIGKTYWNAPVAYRFESGKVLTAIRSDHFSLFDLSKAGNGLERFYFTKEYGFTRWEAWVPETRCKKDHGPDAAICKSIADGNPLSARCNVLNASSAGDAGVDMWGGQKWIRVDCRDQTRFMALAKPQLLIAGGMAQDDGVNDIGPIHDK